MAGEGQESKGGPLRNAARARAAYGACLNPATFQLQYILVPPVAETQTITIGYEDLSSSQERPARVPSGNCMLYSVFTPAYPSRDSINT